MTVLAAAAKHPSAASKAAATLLPTLGMPMQLQPPVLVTDAFAKDAIIAWYRGEFAAANAIIDALCSHLVELGAEGLEIYEAMFAAMHRRRMNWIPVLQMQKHHSIAEVLMELRRVAAARRAGDGKRSEFDEAERTSFCLDGEKDGKCEEGVEKAGDGGVSGEAVDVDEDAPHSDITDSGSQVMQLISEDFQLCSNHEDCQGRTAQIKLTKGFKAKERVNVVKGLKLYKDIFTDSELSKLTNFVDELRLAGHKGELSRESFILFNKQIKGSKRELIQFGLPIFEQIQEEAVNNDELGNIEPIPELIQGVIDHLVQWELIPAHKKPNSCIISFYDEGEYSQPFLKPPHLDHPISTLLLSESTIAFGRFLTSDGDGNYKAPVMLSLDPGSLLVMRGNSVDVARHAMCPSSDRRVSITFFRVWPGCNMGRACASPLFLSPYAFPNYEAFDGYEAVDLVPEWGIMHAPVSVIPVPSPEKMLCGGGGTGVFLPWTVGSRRRGRQLPPRAQKGKRLE
ncbi:hypothetical protein CDL15_Pgr010201 [Punica granatum]|uniref:Fe2OG dioxygenase domain-containing protein n=1 Tax=Punica granatum TaxID=22663 RepID=A0A218XR91_PUNGR|nr:hypothetical protein CDL15_Pgr010201 [Punica granatum]PKI70575.1 hypothetical protein CRG98_009080 [Punica granatum]